ncbi:MAG TPA: spore protease YyaC [Firmicutes bacterium]|uniref:Spore protease YyaC n=1 Tax=Candidatus Fermentithermobacillus carboniphilus TaxID=3085328 RepID=A0AAT9LBE9_9FIRM|nr:MAG: spore protease YyaC [Candidatus Fermentithermobacillus carboniphilus]HHW19206.1 spore protease YyaC [Candidatus Fermentithermobacillaceae bacterium]
MSPAFPLLVICVGSDRATGDSLGPLVGTFLTWSGFPGKVLGTLDNPVHAGNLETTLEEIKGERVTVLGVDACLGVKAEVGTIIVRQGSLKPGLGVKKKLPPVGDLHIAGVVNVGGFMEYTVLQNTRLGLVMKMAQTIASGIVEAEQRLRGLASSRTSGPVLPQRFTHGVPMNDEPRLLPLPVFDRQR